MPEYLNPAQDLVPYFYPSEQIPTAIAQKIYFDPRGRVSGAAGFSCKRYRRET